MNVFCEISLSNRSPHAVVAKMVTDKKISVDYAKEILAGM